MGIESRLACGGLCGCVLRGGTRNNRRCWFRRSQGRCESLSPGRQTKRQAIDISRYIQNHIDLSHHARQVEKRRPAAAAQAEGSPHSAGGGGWTSAWLQHHAGGGERTDGQVRLWPAACTAYFGNSRRPISLWSRTTGRPPMKTTSGVGTCAHAAREARARCRGRRLEAIVNHARSSRALRKAARA